MENTINGLPSQINSKKKIYSPRIKPDKVYRLYRLKQLEKINMTVLVDIALELYLSNKESIHPELRKEIANV